MLNNRRCQGSSAARLGDVTEEHRMKSGRVDLWEDSGPRRPTQPTRREIADPQTHANQRSRLRRHQDETTNWTPCFALGTSAQTSCTTPGRRSQPSLAQLWQLTRDLTSGLSRNADTRRLFQGSPANNDHSVLTQIRPIRRRASFHLRAKPDFGRVNLRFCGSSNGLF